MSRSVARLSSIFRVTSTPTKKTTIFSRYDTTANHRFEKVNSSHHQAVDRIADGLEVEAWCVTDGIIEQMRLRNYPFALAVQYHPERGRIYDALFEDFFASLNDH